MEWYILLKELPDLEKWTIIYTDDDWEFYFEDKETMIHNDYHWILYRLIYKSTYPEWVEKFNF